jgi:hypothetical protein
MELTSESAATANTCGSIVARPRYVRSRMSKSPVVRPRIWLTVAKPGSVKTILVPSGGAAKISFMARMPPPPSTLVTRTSISPPRFFSRYGSMSRAQASNPPPAA